MLAVAALVQRDIVKIADRQHLAIVHYHRGRSDGAAISMEWAMEGEVTVEITVFNEECATKLR